MVGITYTGIDGKTTTFNATSPLMAIKRLSSIKGYNGGTEGDRIAQQYASSLKNRRKERAEKFMSSPSNFFGSVPGTNYMSPSGRVKESPSVSSISAKDGKIIETTRNNLISEEGRIVGIGSTRQKTVLDVQSMIDESMKANRSNGDSRTIKVVVESTYDNKTHKFVNKVATIRVEDIESYSYEEVFTAVRES